MIRGQFTSGTRTLDTVVCRSQDEADSFINSNPGYGVIGNVGRPGTANHAVHCAKVESVGGTGRQRMSTLPSAKMSTAMVVTEVDGIARGVVFRGRESFKFSGDSVADLSQQAAERLNCKATDICVKHAHPTTAEPTYMSTSRRAFDESDLSHIFCGPDGSYYNTETNQFLTDEQLEQMVGLRKAVETHNGFQFMSTYQFSTKAGQWIVYKGPRGGEGWQNTATKEVRYIKEKPDDDEPETEHKGLERIFPKGHEHRNRIFYDAKEGKYYDLSQDVYLEHDEMAKFGKHWESMAGGVKSKPSGETAIKPQSEDRVAWERAVTTAVERLLDTDTSDTQGIIGGLAAEMEVGFSKKTPPDEMAKIIDKASRSRPENLQDMEVRERDKPKYGKIEDETALVPDAAIDRVLDEYADEPEDDRAEFRRHARQRLQTTYERNKTWRKKLSGTHGNDAAYALIDHWAHAYFGGTGDALLNFGLIRKQRDESGGEKPGVHGYHPEMGEKKPEAQIEASLSHYGGHYFLDTPLDLSGVGIKPMGEYKSSDLTPQGQRKVGWKKYKVTEKAFEKLKDQYSISMEHLL